MEVVSFPRILSFFISIFLTFFFAYATDEKVECTLASLTPSMGPFTGGTLVSMTLECSTNNTALIEDIFLNHVYAAFDDLRTDILFVNNSGYIVTDSFNTIETTIASWRYSVSVK